MNVIQNICLHISYIPELFFFSLRPGIICILAMYNIPGVFTTVPHLTANNRKSKGTKWRMHHKSRSDLLRRLYCRTQNTSTVSLI